LADVTRHMNNAWNIEPNTVVQLPLQPQDKPTESAA